MLTLTTLDFADVADIVSDAWASEVKTEQKRRRHRIEMVKFRQNRKTKQQNLRGEFKRLEEQVKQATASHKALAASNSPKVLSTGQVLRELFVEIEDLRIQNGGLRKQLSLYRNFHQVLKEAEAPNAQEVESIVPSIDLHTGWRVRFSGGEPSFHYHPFTREVFDTIMDECTLSLMSAPKVSLGGVFLGWNVHRATVSATSDDHCLVAKSQFTKRLHCSLLQVDEAMVNEDKNNWPVIVTPMNWGGVSGHANAQVLQEFDENTCVLVHNAKGKDLNVRYLCLVQRHRWTEQEGKRAITYTMRIADSEENKRNRKAEGDDSGVQWITEGGSQLTIVEQDSSTVDVVYDHWGGCESELHAQYLFVQWANYALRWEQMVLRSRSLPA
ncbi:hypothetical protein P3T76_005677 [Phytophthora citrophthora]|uniref:BZIP domain-containing protein n=1 Tax=Phytophthora citrophthora TaxID=4793 RepID=A0AAD9LN15_9STRA|nr:hypothetical protein P3T76_005677 [Phytophthora citrophthora]